MLQDGFYNKCAVIVHFELQNWGKKVISLHVGLRVKYRKTEMFLFFSIFGDRDEDSIVGIKKERKTLISCHLVTFRASFRVSIRDDGPERPIMKSDRCTI